MAEKEREGKRSLNGCRLGGGEITAVGAKAMFDGATKITFCTTCGDKFQAARIALPFLPDIPSCAGK